MSPQLTTRRLLAIAGLAAVALSAPATASAACPGQTEKRAFAAFGDQTSYFQVPNGGFESSFSGWATGGSPSIRSGNEPWYAGSAGDVRSATLPVASGAWVVSPRFCVSMATPTMRFFVRSDAFGTSTSNWGYLSVEARYWNRATGASLGSIYLGTVNRSDGAWVPSAPLSLVVSGPLNGGNLSEADAQLVFTAHGAGPGTFTIDDAYVDPYKCC